MGTAIQGEDEYDSEDNIEDADESESEAEGTSDLVTTSCRQQNQIGLDDESSGSDNDELPDRLVHCQRFPIRMRRVSHHGGFPRMVG